MSVDCGGAEASVERQLSALLPVEDRARRQEPRARLLQAGTIFLHEVGKLSPGLQVRLADAVETVGTIESRVRSRRRVMAFTSEPLLARVAAGTFDARLFYRLNVIHIVIRD